MDRPSPEDLLKHAGFLRALAFRLVGDDARADDLVQDAYVAALERPPQGSVRAWLGAVVRNLAGKMRRSESRRLMREHGASRPEPLPPADDVAARIALPMLLPSLGACSPLVGCSGPLGIARPRVEKRIADRLPWQIRSHGPATQHAFPAHSEFLEHARGGGVVDVAGCLNPMDLRQRCHPPEHGLCGFGGVAMAPKSSVHEESELGTVTVEAAGNASDGRVVRSHGNAPCVLVTRLPAASRALDGASCVFDAR